MRARAQAASPHLASERSSRYRPAAPPEGDDRRVAGEQFTLHLRAWRTYSRLPRFARVSLVIVAVAALIDLALLAGSNREAAIRAAVGLAVREATGPDPASSCLALSPAGLSQVVSTFGAEVAASSANPLATCEQLVPRLRTEATAQQLADLARGHVSAVQFHTDGSALVVYLAADRRLGAELTMSERGGRWLIDSVAGGPIAGASEATTP